MGKGLYMHMAYAGPMRVPRGSYAGPMRSHAGPMRVPRGSSLSIMLLSSNREFQ